MELEELKRKLEIKERQIVDLQQVSRVHTTGSPNHGEDEDMLWLQESSQLVEQRDALASKYTKLKGHVMQIQVYAYTYTHLIQIQC